MHRPSLVAIVSVLVLGGCDGLFGLTTVRPACSVEACEAAGGTCIGDEVCELTCTSGTCVCPPDLSCQLDVRAMNVMVDCRSAVDCAIRCLADSTGGGICRDSEIRCGRGQCTVSCVSEQYSCTGLSLLCGNGPCSLDCAQLGSCQVGASVQCGRAEECTTTCGQDACASLNVSCDQATTCTATCSPGGNNSCNNASLMCQQASTCELDCAGRPGCTSS